MFLIKVHAAVSVLHVEQSLKKILTKFFNKYKLPVPRIKIVDSSANWLGRTTFDPKIDKSNSTIEIQKRITEDEKSLDRVIAHELIHHWQFMTYPSDEVKHSYKDTHDGHGVDFHTWAQKINSVMGKDYVTEVSDTTYVEQIGKDYYLLIVPINKTTFGWAWSPLLTAEQKQVVNIQVANNARLFLSKDSRFLCGVKIKKDSKLSVPREKELMAELKNIYFTKKQVK